VDDFLLDPEMQWEQVKYSMRMDGRDEGIKIGFQKGIQSNSVEVAQRMLSKGEDMGYVSEISGLDESTVRELKEKMDRKE